MSILKYLAASALALVLMACGGGGGSAGLVASTGSTATGTSTASTSGTGTSATTGTSTTVATPTVTAVGDLVVRLDKVNVSNAGNGVVTLSVDTIDATRNALKEIPIKVSLIDVSGGAVFYSAAASTDAQGKFTGLISTGAVKSDRVISVVVTANQSVSKTVAFNVVGSSLRMTSIPGAPLPGTTATLVIELKDATANPISGEKITIAGNIPSLLGKSVTLDSLGKAQLVYTAPSVQGGYSVELSGSGVSLAQTIEIRASGATPVVSALITAASLAANPTVVGINKTGDTTNRSQLKALFFTSNNTPLKDVRVIFDIVPVGLGAGEQISTGSSTVLTDISGIATADYIPGTRSSPTDGVLIRISYAGGDFNLGDTTDSIGNTVKTATTKLTVASNPLSLSLGDNNKLEKGPNELTYIKRFVLLVADSAGQPVADASVSFSVDIYKYGKGFYSDATYARPSVTGESGTFTAALNPLFPLISTVLSTDGLNVVSTASFTATVSNITGVAVTPFVAPYVRARSWCLNEDVNRNGAIDAGEDRNGNGSLEPRKADILISSDTGVNKTDSGGLLTIKVQYPQSVATWLSYIVKASASVGGSEGTVSKRYTTDFVLGDEVNGSFLLPPYGSNYSCNNPN